MTRSLRARFFAFLISLAGMVVRMYEGDRQGRVLHVGTK